MSDTDGPTETQGASDTPHNNDQTKKDATREIDSALAREGWDITEKLDSGDSDQELVEVDDASPEASISEDGPELSAEEVPALARRVEALLFVSPRPMSARRLAELVDLSSVVPIRQAAEYLSTTYEGHAFALKELAGGYQLLTDPEYESDVLKLQKQKKAKKLTAGALETLAVIAYKQPITRNEIDNIRGVASDHHIRALAERNLTKVVGRKTDGTFGGGAPALYGTTTQFLNEFSLKSLAQLPTTEDMVKQAPQDEEGENSDNQEEAIDPNAVAATQAVDLSTDKAAQSADDEDQASHEEEEASATDA